MGILLFLLANLRFCREGTGSLLSAVAGNPVPALTLLSGCSPPEKIIGAHGMRTKIEMTKSADQFVGHSVPHPQN